VDGLLTVEENLLFAARLSGLGGSAARTAVRSGMEQSGLTTRASTPARQLSGGWRRLLDITRASLHRPDLLILDEPTVGLDPEHRERLWSMLETERRTRGTTVLFSTHYLTEAEPSDRVVLLSAGRVVGNDTPEALKSTVGVEVAEIEGPGTAHLVERLRGLSGVVSRVSTERGARVGLNGFRETVVELAGSASGIERFALRPATLEDVYFARTQRVASDEPR
jgi:ABC-2 type transport system ATP-binding protein